MEISFFSLRKQKKKTFFQESKKEKKILPCNKSSKTHVIIATLAEI
jgi:hypothetical protein